MLLLDDERIWTNAPSRTPSLKMEAMHVFQSPTMQQCRLTRGTRNQCDIKVEDGYKAAKAGISNIQLGAALFQEITSFKTTQTETA
jgi:hypothetical protein